MVVMMMLVVVGGARVEEDCICRRRGTGLFSDWAEQWCVGGPFVLGSETVSYCLLAAVWWRGESHCECETGLGRGQWGRGGVRVP